MYGCVCTGDGWVSELCGWTDKWVGVRVGGYMGGIRVDGWVEMDGWVYGYVGVQVQGIRVVGWVAGRMGVRVDG